VSTSARIWVINSGRQRQLGPTEVVKIKSDLSASGWIEGFVTFVDGQPVTFSCRWGFSGLTAGEYVALLTRQDGSGGLQRFRLDPDKRLTIVVPPPIVTLSGVATRNGNPAAKIMLRVAVLPFARTGHRRHDRQFRTLQSVR
jgi:hypothetical protein